MTSFKLSKKDALSDTRTNIYYLHEQKLNFFESEKSKLNFYLQELPKHKKHSPKREELELKIFNIQDDHELNQYLLDFFSILNNFNNNYYVSQKGLGTMDSFINSKINNSKSELYNEYINKFNQDLEPMYLNKKEKQICLVCNSESFIHETTNSVEICTSCGSTTTLLNSDTDPVYSINKEKDTVFNYKRNNHFQECLNQLQAKENTTIPQNIIDDLTMEFKKYNIVDRNLFTTSLVKNYLKKLKYNKYYEHIPTIINIFCGLKAPTITPELEQQLKIMFDEIQDPFERHSQIICPSRKNFLNYNYVFYKMCQLLNKDEFLCYFPLLKSREKLYEHDLIWKGICNDLRWEYIATI